MEEIGSIEWLNKKCEEILEQESAEALKNMLEFARLFNELTDSTVLTTLETEVREREVKYYEDGRTTKVL